MPSVSPHGKAQRHSKPSCGLPSSSQLFPPQRLSPYPLQPPSWCPSHSNIIRTTDFRACLPQQNQPLQRPPKISKHLYRGSSLDPPSPETDLCESGGSAEPIPFVHHMLQIQSVTAMVPASNAVDPVTKSNKVV